MGNDICEKGSKGTLCEECEYENGYYYNDKLKKCSKCDSHNYFIFLQIFLITVVLLYIIR